MSSESGLTKYGFTSFSSCNQASCASNIIKVAMSAFMILWLVYQFVMQIKVHMRFAFSWQQVMLVQIFLCLSFNICFSLWSDVVTWYILQELIYHFYFTTLVYYFSKKYLEKRIKFQQRKPYIVGLILAYTLFCLAELGIFIYMVNLGLHHCKQIAQIVVNAVMITLGLVFFYLAYQNQTQQRKKFQEYGVNLNATNPLKNIWVWVCLNIIGQIISQVENGLIYSYYGGSQCYPIESNIQTDVLSPIFLALTYGISFCSTLWFYDQKRRQQQNSLSISFSQLQLAQSQTDIQNRVQIIKYSTNSNQSQPLLQTLI